MDGQALLSQHVSWFWELPAEATYKVMGKVVSKKSVEGKQNHVIHFLVLVLLQLTTICGLMTVTEQFEFSFRNVIGFALTTPHGLA